MSRYTEQQLESALRHVEVLIRQRGFNVAAAICNGGVYPNLDAFIHEEDLTPALHEIVDPLIDIDTLRAGKALELVWDAIIRLKTGESGLMDHVRSSLSEFRRVLGEDSARRLVSEIVELTCPDCQCSIV